jgi:hypothetical protein
MPRGALPTIAEIPPDVLADYKAGTIGYREVARRIGRPRNTTLRALVRLGHTAGRGEVDRQGAASRERWVPVPAGPHAAAYAVSSRGRVRRTRAGQGTAATCLKPCPAHGGHPIVNLCHEGRVKPVMVASLVAGAFLPPPPGPHAALLHRDRDPMNCAAANLYWGTWSEVSRRRGKAR